MVRRQHHHHHNPTPLMTTGADSSLGITQPSLRALPFGRSGVAFVFNWSVQLLKVTLIRAEITTGRFFGLGAQRIHRTDTPRPGPAQLLRDPDCGYCAVGKEGAGMVKTGNKTIPCHCFACLSRDVVRLSSTLEQDSKAIQKWNRTAHSLTRECGNVQ